MIIPIVISTQYFLENQIDRVKYVDVRAEDAYQQGHITNAVHLAPPTLNRSEGESNGLLPDPSGVKSLISQIGLQADDHLVVYDQGAGTAAARLVWVLHAYGFFSVSWLNGGFNAWAQAGLPVSTQTHPPQPSSLELSFTPGNMLTADEVIHKLGDKHLHFLDVRSLGEYDGSDKRSARGGHMPKAKHVEWTLMLNEDGELKPDAELHEMFTAQGINHNQTVLTYCQTHQRSAMTYVVLKHLGYTDVTALDGAWSTWGNRSDTPIDSES